MVLDLLQQGLLVETTACDLLSLKRLISIDKFILTIFKIYLA